MSNTKSYHEKEINTQELYKEWNDIIQQGIDVKKKQQEQSKYYTKLDQSFIACRNKINAILPEVEALVEKVITETPVIPLKHNYKKGEKHITSQGQEAKELKLVQEGTSYADLLITLKAIFEAMKIAKREMDRMNGVFKYLHDQLKDNNASGTVKLMIDTLTKMDVNRHQPGNLKHLKAGKEMFVKTFKSYATLLNITQIDLDNGITDSKRDVDLLANLDSIINQGFAFIQKFFAAIILTYTDEDGKDEQLDKGLDLLIETHKVILAYRYHISELNLHSLEALHTLTKKQNYMSKMMTIQALFYETLFDQQ